MEVLPIPPKNVRPSKFIEYDPFELANPTNEEAIEMVEDDLTHKLVDILRINQRIIENISAEAPELIIEDLWELLQYHITTYIDNKTEGIPPSRHYSGRKLITVTEKLVRTKFKSEFSRKNFKKYLDRYKKSKTYFEEDWS